MDRLARLIQELIRAEGPIPFASFMDMALYHPGLGYYASDRHRIGASGDYYTSPQAHPVFGALLALQLERMWQIMGRPPRFHVMEGGAGDGRLARDLLKFSRRLEPGFAEAIYYVAVDVKPLRTGDAALPRNGGQARSRPERPAPALHAVASRTIPFRGLQGCILSNELLDAFPVHRLVVRGGRLKEVYVDVRSDTFEEVLGELSPPVENLLEFGDEMPAEGSRIEICPSAWLWMLEAGRALDAGFVLTIDYGYGEAPGEDTLASYRRHSVSSPYHNVGEQDLTAHVDFGACMEAGRRSGLRAIALVSQRRFLLRLGLGDFREAAARRRLPQKEHEANQMAMLDLVRPEGLGTFGVMVQCKGFPGLRLGNLVPERPVRERLASGELPVPLLGPEHMPLLEGRYPELAWEP